MTNAQVRRGRRPRVSPTSASLKTGNVSPNSICSTYCRGRCKIYSVLALISLEGNEPPRLATMNMLKLEVVVVLLLLLLAVVVVVVVVVVVIIIVSFREEPVTQVVIFATVEF
jgi:hypothetical protein